MFDQIGSKIKTLAKIECWIGVISSVILGVLCASSLPFLAIIIIVAGSVLSWICSFFTYGFGQLVENSDLIAYEIRNMNSYDDSSFDESQDEEEPYVKNKWTYEARDGMTRCKLCGVEQKEENTVCKNCGSKL